MENKPRKPWIAGLLSLTQPGLGQMYNGEILKALVFYLLPMLVIPGLILCLHSEFVRICLVSIALFSTAYYVIALIDAVRTANRYKDNYLPKKFNRAIAYAGVFLLAVMVNISTSAILKSSVVKAYKLPSASMEPTLLIGDHILLDRSQAARSPQKGAIIVFEYPEDSSKDFIKRVVATGGDTVEIRDKQLYVNGIAVKEPYIAHKEADMIPASQNPRDNFGPQIVPVGTYFVMGDNRDRSYDSRFWGIVRGDKVKGTVKDIYWSWDKETLSVRWDRVGMKVL